MKTIKIAVTGPEGSGKSILAAALGHYFKFPIVEDPCEYFLTKETETEITPKLLVQIANKKLQKEKEILLNQPKCLISDGELLMLKIWSEYKFNSYPPDLKELVNQQYYDLYILTKPEALPKYPFIREDQSLRMYFFNAFKKEFTEKQLSYLIAEGDFYPRKKLAVDAIENLLANEALTDNN